MSIWHRCEGLKKVKGVIRVYTVGKTWMAFPDHKCLVWDIKCCPYCCVKVDDLKNETM